MERSFVEKSKILAGYKSEK